MFWFNGIHLILAQFQLTFVEETIPYTPLPYLIFPNSIKIAKCLCTRYILILHHFLLTFENLCEHEENCLISKLKSSSLVSSSSSVSIWWYFSERATVKGNKLFEFIRKNVYQALKLTKSVILILRLFLMKCQTTSEFASCQWFW